MTWVVIGAGYVGMEYERMCTVHEQHCVLVDVDKAKVEKLRANGKDAYTWSTLPNNDQDTRVWVICAPTPVDDDLKPDERAVTAAAREVVARVRTDDTVLLVSTVALRTLELIQLMFADKDVCFAHVPERMCPGTTTPEQAVHLVGADRQGDVNAVITLLTSIGLRPMDVSSAKTAALAKLLENTKRDVNIALLNEFALAARHAGVSVHEVIAAAETKPGFNDTAFTPGLVGGHCIAVDPWLLVDGLVDGQLAMTMHRPVFQPLRMCSSSLAAAARRVNDATVGLVADLVGFPTDASNLAVVIGAAFKPNCPDVRNSGAAELAEELMFRGWRVVLVDPIADAQAFAKEFPRLDLRAEIPNEPTGAVVLAVVHDDCVVTEAYTANIVEHGVLADPWAVAPWLMFHDDTRVYRTL